MDELKPCLICGHDDTYVCCLEDRIGIATYSVFCNGCKTSFSNELVEDTEHETAEWYNSINITQPPPKR